MNPLETVKAGPAGIAEKITGENPKLFPELVKLVQNMPGGVSGLIKEFQDKGLTNVVSFLTGKGTKEAISADQILKGFGSEKINALATATGLDPKIVPEKVATLLPKVVEQLTPVANLAGVS